MGIEIGILEVVKVFKDVNNKKEVIFIGPGISEWLLRSRSQSQRGWARAGVACIVLTARVFSKPIPLHSLSSTIFSSCIKNKNTKTKLEKKA